MTDSKVALVTGATRGIGEEIARELARRGCLVLVGARDLARGAAVAAQIRESGGRAAAIALDVTDASTITAAAAAIRRDPGRLDILVNNAGIAGRHWPEGVSMDEIQRRGAPSVAALEDVRAVFETNVFGVIAVTQGVLPLLREAPAGRIVNVSSSLGSLTFVTDPAYQRRRIGGVAYAPSKSALNAVTVAFAQELEPTRIKVNAACPGYTATALNGFSGTRTVAEAARAPVSLAMLDDDGPTGTLHDDRGVVPW
jgi:NAD(P)-dependent dehydrogenase (short-subunit alcohol dehydrogenase family)